MSETISQDLTLGQLAAQAPQVIPFLFENDMDFCCGGKQSIAQACLAKGLDQGQFMAEVDRWIASNASESVPTWDQSQVPALIAFILSRFHETHRRDLNILEPMMAKVHKVHGEKDGIARLAALCQGIADDIEPHMQKEERILFPLILSLFGEKSAGSFCSGDPRGPIAVMFRDHDHMGAMLDDLVAVTQTFTPPAWACATVKGLFSLLERLNRDIRVHIHLENNVLFPMTLKQIEMETSEDP